MTLSPQQYSKAMKFRWITLSDRLPKGRLAGCRGPRSGDDLRFLVTAGIRCLVRLAHEGETGLTSEAVKQAGIEDYYEPFGDFEAPTPEQINATVDFINESLRQGKPVVVSCNAGYGRTGTILACFLVSIGVEPHEATQKIGTIESESQTQAVIKYAARLAEKPQ